MKHNFPMLSLLIILTKVEFNSSYGQSTSNFYGKFISTLITSMYLIRIFCELTHSETTILRSFKKWFSDLFPWIEGFESNGIELNIYINSNLIYVNFYFYFLFNTVSKISIMDITTNDYNITSYIT